MSPFKYSVITDQPTLLLMKPTSLGTPQESTKPPPTSNAATATLGTPHTARCRATSAAAGPPHCANCTSLLDIFLYLSGDDSPE